jgi:hypothetical protein
MSDVTTTREILTTVGQTAWLVPYLVGLPVLAAAMGVVDGNGKRGAWPFAYSTVVYAACIPGILAAVLIAYMIGVAHENLLDAPMATTLGPLLSMILTLGLVSRQVNFRDLPGIDRLWGLMLTLAMTFIFGFVLTRTHFVVMFHGSFTSLLVSCVVIFLVLQYGLHLMFRRKESEPTGW